MELHSILCYNDYMSDILIAGKEMPDSVELAESLAKTNRNVMSAAKVDVDFANFEIEGIYGSTWNRSSAISARSFLLNGETKLRELDQYVILFDSKYYASKFELDRTENVSSAVDTMIASYQFLINELTLRLDQRKDPVTVMFLEKSYPSRFELVNSGSRNANIVATSNIVNCAQAAFEVLAENFATYVNEKAYLSVVLAKCEHTNDIYDNEAAIGEWIARTMDSVAASKSKQTLKQACTWQKVGGKVSSGFSLFK